MTSFDEFLPPVLISVGVVAAGLLISWLLTQGAKRRIEGDYKRFYARKFIRYGTVVVASSHCW